MIAIPEEDLEFKTDTAIELLCLDIIKNLKKDLEENKNLISEIKGVN